MRVGQFRLASLVLLLSATAGCGAAATSPAQSSSAPKTSSAASVPVTSGVSAAVRAYQDIVARNDPAVTRTVELCVLGSASQCHDILGSGSGDIRRFLDDLSHASVPAQLQALDTQLREELSALQRIEVALMAALNANDHAAVVTGRNQIETAGDPSSAYRATIDAIQSAR